MRNSETSYWNGNDWPIIEDDPWMDDSQRDLCKSTLCSPNLFDREYKNPADGPVVPTLEGHPSAPSTPSQPRPRPDRRFRREGFGVSISIHLMWFYRTVHDPCLHCWPHLSDYWWDECHRFLGIDRLFQVNNADAPGCRGSWSFGLSRGGVRKLAATFDKYPSEMWHTSHRPFINRNTMAPVVSAI